MLNMQHCRLLFYCQITHMHTYLLQSTFCKLKYESLLHTLISTLSQLCVCYFFSFVDLFSEDVKFASPGT